MTRLFYTFALTTCLLHAMDTQKTQVISTDFTTYARRLKTFFPEHSTEYRRYLFNKITRCQHLNFNEFSQTIKTFFPQEIVQNRELLSKKIKSFADYRFNDFSDKIKAFFPDGTIPTEYHEILVNEIKKNFDPAPWFIQQRLYFLVKEMNVKTDYSLAKDRLERAFSQTITHATYRPSPNLNDIIEILKLNSLPFEKEDDIGNSILSILLIVRHENCKTTFPHAETIYQLVLPYVPADKLMLAQKKVEKIREEASSESNE